MSFTPEEYDLILSSDQYINVEDFGTFDYDYAKMSVYGKNNQYIGSVVSGSVLPSVS